MASRSQTPSPATYWCHQCDMSVALISSSIPNCPDCHANFLEPMDSPLLLRQNDDTFLLDSPAFRRLLLLSSSDPITHLFPNVQKSAMDSIATVKISSSCLEPDSMLLCAVCKDPLLLDSDAKQLPCRHLYHPDCILPWLSNHNSCPLCRSTLPTQHHHGSNTSKVNNFLMELDEDDADRHWTQLRFPLNSGDAPDDCPTVSTIIS
ncbi:E3 ubiquitin-protein ligase RING1-like isoform X1 [Durio zibethinus]|uniref:RING-type E3 ubiquitin transferase n=1 Tax=Durio zibethinus TaxID=66656 RepID=A0A6P5ZNH4_DURZI|nr:E3 ubiquitin-protein ligase RING1-like isoform X1 [Durio zibethinus]